MTSVPMSSASTRNESATADFPSVALLIARICFACDFLLYGSRKFDTPPVVYKLLVTHHLPGQLVYPTIALQLGGGLCILLGFQARLVSMVFAFFCLFAPSIFWNDNLENLTRDYATAGGFLLLALCGPGKLSLDSMFSRTQLRDVVQRFFSGLQSQVLNRNVALAARLLIALPFLADVVKKLVHLTEQQELYASRGLPGGVVFAAIAVQLFFGLALALGRRPTMAAVGLLAWTVFAALTIHFPTVDTNLAAHGGLGGTIAANFAVAGAGLTVSFFKDVTTAGALLVFLAFTSLARKL